MLFFVLIKFLEVDIFSGRVRFDGRYYIFCFAILVSSGLIQDFLTPFACVLFTKQAHKKKVMIGLALMRGMILFLSDAGIIVSCLAPIIYTILSCFYIFGWFGRKTEYSTFSMQYRSFTSEAPRPHDGPTAHVEQF